MLKDDNRSNSIIETINSPSAEEFLNTLRRSNSRWVGETEIDTGWIFRGQSNTIWNLRASAFREQKENEDTLLGKYLHLMQRRYSTTDWLNWVQPTVKSPLEIDTTLWNKLIGNTAIRTLAHAALVRDFVLLADSAKHRIQLPNILWHLENKESPSLKQLFNGCISSIDSVFAIAQHHGIPTGLIDWTYNPLIAAYFAAEQPQGAKITVWALKANILRTSQYLRRLTLPPQEIPFLDAQEGLFIWCPQAYLIHLHQGKFPNLEDLVILTAQEIGLDVFKEPLLLKLTLPANEAPELLKLLWREKISPAHLMPTFDNVTRALKTQITLSPNLYGPN